MAGDLIPPPSPAGRPEPDSSEKAAAAREAGGLWAADAPGARRPGRGRRRGDDARAAARGAPSRPSAPASASCWARSSASPWPRSRVGVLMATDEPDPAPPAGHVVGVAALGGRHVGKAEEIAGFVAPRYRDKGNLLVGVDASRARGRGHPARRRGARDRRGRRVHRGRRRDVHAQRPRRHGLDRVRHAVAAAQRARPARGARAGALLLPLHRRPRHGRGAAAAVDARTVAKARTADTTPTLTAMLLRPGGAARPARDPAHGDDPAADAEGRRSSRADNPETKVVSALTTPNVFAVTFQQAQDAKTYLVLAAPRRPSSVPAGLCALCAHQKLVRTGRGSVFSMCLRARTDPRFAKYPQLPVVGLPRVRAR